VLKHRRARLCVRVPDVLQALHILHDGHVPTSTTVSEYGLCSTGVFSPPSQLQAFEHATIGLLQLQETMQVTEVSPNSRAHQLQEDFLDRCARFAEENFPLSDRKYSTSTGFVLSVTDSWFESRTVIPLLPASPNTVHAQHFKVSLHSRAAPCMYVGIPPTISTTLELPGTHPCMPWSCLDRIHAGRLRHTQAGWRCDAPLMSMHVLRRWAFQCMCMLMFKITQATL
jgi:hypothetical protein